MKQSILYLDDEPACLDIFRITFEGDYDVRTATTLVEARLLLSERAAEIVISDQSLPETEGTEFLREVAMKYPSSYRVILTGTSTVGSIVCQISSGIVQAFIVKPWTPEKVQQVLERAIVSVNSYAKTRHQEASARPANDSR